MAYTAKTSRCHKRPYLTLDKGMRAFTGIFFGAQLSIVYSRQDGEHERRYSPSGTGLPPVWSRCSWLLLEVSDGDGALIVGVTMADTAIVLGAGAPGAIGAPSAQAVC